MTNIEQYRGDDKLINLTFTENGSFYNLSGATIFFSVKDRYNYTNQNDDTSAIISKTVTSHTSAVSGLSAITVTGSDTQLVVPDIYVYDMRLKDTSGKIFKFASGYYNVTADVTRRRT